MANDISYFKVEGDETQYSFNDADLEARIGATALPTTAQTITGAIAEHEGDISSLNSRFAFQSASDLNSLTASGMYFCYNCTNAPTTSSQYWSLMVVGTNNGSSANQIASASFTNGQTYQRYYANGTWSSWEKWPSRAEITSLNSNFNGYLQVEVKTVEGATTAGGTAKDYSFSAAKTGYALLGCVGFRINAGSVISVASVWTDYQNNTVTVRTINPSSSSLTPSNVQVTCLYRKNI